MSFLIVDDPIQSLDQSHAAQEFQHYFRLMTGALLPIDTNEAEQPTCEKSIFIGRSEQLDQLNFHINWKELGTEGYLLTFCEDNLIIAGNSPRGILYGVYGLFEDYFGCKWFTPMIEKVPKAESLCLPSDLYDLQMPVLEYREVQFWETMIDANWAVRNRMNGHFCRIPKYKGGSHRYYPFGHSFRMLVNPNDYFEEHPEYFSEINNQRIRDSSQLCLTNEDVRKISLKKVKKWIAENPEVTIVSISQNDGFNACNCAKCRAIDEREGSKSGTLIDFVNYIAEGIEKEYPHITIDTLAYNYTRTPPVTIKPRKNVSVRLCSIECCFSHPFGECNAIAYPYDRPYDRPDKNRGFTVDLRDWSKICDRVYIWDYVTNYAHPLMPFPNFKVLQANVKFLIENNVRGIFAEAAFWEGGGASDAELRSYVLAKILWNPEVDVDLLISEFYENVYGEAAELMQSLLELWHSKLEEVHVGIYDPPATWYFDEKVRNEIAQLRKEHVLMSQFFEHAVPLMESGMELEMIGFIDKEMLAKAEQIFNAAQEMMKHSKDTLHRIKKDRLGLRYIQLYLMPLDTKGRNQAIDKFIEDVKSYGIIWLSEGRDCDKIAGFMKKRLMRSLT